jgi:hypothetical protein
MGARKSEYDVMITKYFWTEKEKKYLNYLIPSFDYPKHQGVSRCYLKSKHQIESNNWNF